MSAARGAISLLEKACTVSRMASAVSPRSKLNIRCALGIMVGLPPGKSCGFSRAQPYALQISLSRAKGAEKGAWRENAANSPLLWRAQRAVIRPNNRAFRIANPRERTIREPSHAWDD